MQLSVGRLTCNNNSPRDALDRVVDNSRDVSLPFSFDFRDVQFPFLDQTIDDGRVADGSGNDDAAFAVVPARSRVAKASLASYIESRTGVETGRCAIPEQRHGASRAGYSSKVLG